MTTGVFTRVWNVSIWQNISVGNPQIAADADVRYQSEKQKNDSDYKDETM